MEKKEISRTAFALQILLFLAMNWGGDRLVSQLSWPIWLDSVGTVFCAALYGPVCGALIGATSNLFGYILYGTPWYYALIGMLIGVVVGMAARKNLLSTLLDTLTVTAVLTGCVCAGAYPINLLLNGVSTGNLWGDAVMMFFGERGIPRWAGLLMGQLYVELLDKLISLLLVFVLLRLGRLLHRLWEKHRASAGPGGASLLSLLLAVSLGLSLIPSAPARAGAESSPRINYHDYVQTVYSTSNGLPCGEANDIAMTGDGIIWIGTYAGLYRYNGREFQWMKNFDSIRNVNCLYVDEEGRLWVGTNDNGLSIMIQERVVNVIDQARGLPANSVKSVIKSSDGYYYIGTTGSMQVLTLNSGLKQVSTLSEIAYADHLCADQNGYVAAVTNAGILYLLRQGMIVTSRRMASSQSDFRSCLFTPEGDLLAATTGDEIYRFSIRDGGLYEEEVRSCPGLQNIKTLHIMDSGELFICADNGIAAYTPEGAYEQINTNDFNNSIDNMLVDYQGNLWFTSSRLGLLRLAASDFRDVYATAGMDSRVVNTIVQWQGAYYFGTDKGMNAVDLSGKKQIRDHVTDRFSAVRIRCMLVDSQNHLWVCTYGRGLVELLPDGSEYLYNSENGAFGNRARVVKELRDGTILAAGDTGLSFIRDHQVEHTIGRSDGLITSMVLSILEQEDGTILVGTDGNGIAVLENRRVRRLLTRSHGLSSEVILRLVADLKTGGTFVVTSNGLCYLNADETIRPLNNFPYYNNYDIWMKGTDSLFVLSSAGIYTVDRGELLSGKEDLSYDLLDARRGLSGSLTANAWTWFNEETGELFLPCDTGVFILNTTSFAGGSTLYRMNVTGIRMDGNMQRVDRDGITNIPRGSSKVEIQPEVINYTIQDPYVGYKLEGFDTDWSITAQNTLSSIVYTNLPVGNFNFRLAVFDNSQENILAERSFALRKDKVIYDNSWFIFYLLIVPMFTVFWLTFLLARRHDRKIQAELERTRKEVEMGRQTVSALARTVDAKDGRTAGHSKRVALYSKQIAKAYGLPEKDCQDIEWAASMHDIGKIAIPDHILNKPGRLTDEEYAKMKTHTTEGAKILEGFTLLDHVVEGAEFHHERFDGKGYPKGLRGMEIPLYARIIGVADAFDAMTAARVYRGQMDFDYVLGELERGRGTQFDPTFVDLLLQLIREGQIDLKKIYHVPKDAEAAQAAEKKDAESAAAAPKDGTVKAAPAAGAEKKADAAPAPREEAGEKPASAEKDAAGAAAEDAPRKGGQA